MRDHCSCCGHRFSAREWVELKTKGYQAHVDPSGLALVQQMVDCPHCRATMNALQLEVIRDVYGPLEKLEVIVGSEVSTDYARMRGMTGDWHYLVPSQTLLFTVAA